MFAPIFPYVQAQECCGKTWVGSKIVGRCCTFGRKARYAAAAANSMLPLRLVRLSLPSSFYSSRSRAVCGPARKGKIQKTKEKYAADCFRLQAAKHIAGALFLFLSLLCALVLEGKEEIFLPLPSFWTKGKSVRSSVFSSG